MTKTDQDVRLKDGRRLGFAEYGSSDGYPIVYCHGSQSSRLEMHYDRSFANENDLRIIAVDRPGHGVSDFNPKGSVLSFARDVRDLTDHLEIDRFSVVGMSAGSPFALGIAHLFPEAVYKAAIVSGFAPYTATSRQHLSKEVRSMLRLAKTAPPMVKLLLRGQSRQMSAHPKKALRGLLKIMSEPDKEVTRNDAVMFVIESMFTEAFRHGSVGVAYEVSRVLVHDWGFELKQVQVPVTFWQGGRDNNVPYQWAQAMSSAVPNSTLNLYQDEGHLLIFGHAKEIFMDVKSETV